jgi:hypothetical protein
MTILQLKPHLDRFEALYIPEPMSGCHIWLGALDVGGYAKFSIANSVALSGHIFAYEHKYGPVPDGLELDHVCLMKCCVNPDHVEAVTHQENMRRQLGSRHHLGTCCRGHLFDEANTYIAKNGTRHCRKCDVLRHKKKRGII